MPSAVFPSASPMFAGCQIIPTGRGSMTVNHGVALARGRLPTDSIGAITCTFDGVNADSEIRVFIPDGTEVAGVENCIDNHVLSWGVYAIGSANNTVTIRIVHPAYKIKEFTYLAALGERSLPVQQEVDKWFSNPI